MEIKYICPYWGQGHLSVDKFIINAMDAGFDGVEMNVPFDEEFLTLLLETNLKYGAEFIAQQYLPPVQETVEEYSIRMETYLRHLAGLNPIFINSHTGKDFFSFDENSFLIKVCNMVSAETGVKIIHETHRGRFPFQANTVLSYLRKYKNLELNADFSHFCAVSESILEDQEHILNEIIPRCSYVHARVGYSQSAQVNHPFAPEWQTTLEHFVAWWQQIIDNAKLKGEQVFYICPEFGPAPYMPALPFTQQLVANQWDINIQMMEFLRNTLK